MADEDDEDGAPPALTGQVPRCCAKGHGDCEMGGASAKTKQSHKEAMNAERVKSLSATQSQ